MDGFYEFPDNSDYLISKEGKVFSKKKNIFRKTYISKRGYLALSIRKENKAKLVTIHRLIALIFIPNPNNFDVVNHIDGNKLNNNIENLEWCTQTHNMKEAYRLGLIKINKAQYTENFSKNREKRKGLTPHNAKSIILNGIKYSSFVKAGAAIGVSGNTIQRNIAGKRDTLKAHTLSFA